MIPGWKDEIQREYLEFLREHRRVSPPELAAHLKLSEHTAVYWLTDLAREGKLRILAVEIVEEGTLSGEPGGAVASQREDSCPEEAEAQLAGAV